MRIVIDASVVIECPEGPVFAPSTTRVFHFMKAFRKTDHVAVGTRVTFGEWRFRNRYVWEWKAELFARNRLEKLPDNTEIMNKIRDRVVDQETRQELLKDSHLFEAATATDLRVVSADDKARGYAKKSLNVLPELTDVIWVNPADEDERATQWLVRGAPEEAPRRLSGK